MQTEEEFQEALEEAKGLILPEYGIYDVSYMGEDGDNFAISFAVSNHPWQPFRPTNGYRLPKKDTPWTPEEIFRAIAEFAIRIRT